MVLYDGSNIEHGCGFAKNAEPKNPCSPPVVFPFAKSSVGASIKSALTCGVGTLGLRLTLWDQTERDLTINGETMRKQTYTPSTGISNDWPFKLMRKRR